MTWLHQHVGSSEISFYCTQFATIRSIGNPMQHRLALPHREYSSTEAFKQTTNGSPLKGAVVATLAQNDDSPGDSGGRVLSERLAPATLCVDRTDSSPEGQKTAVQN